MNIIADELKLRHDAGAILVIEKIKSLDLDNEALIYYNFPFYRGETLDDLVQAHVLYISKIYGIIAFRIIASIDKLNEHMRKQIDELDSHLFSKINKIEELRKGRRDLKINITPIVVVCDGDSKNNDGFSIVSINGIKKCIEENKTEELSSNDFKILVATIEGTKRSKQKKDRDISDEKLTKGKVLSLIQQQETVFDLEQKRAALNTIDSPQRIRGLAGSGKTIILTMKAALYHLQNPDSLILYTYFTKALYGQIKYLIEKYYRDFSDNQEPNWNNIQILHGWGGASLAGVYSEACSDNHISPMSLPEARRNNVKNPFDYACMSLLKHNIKSKYDLTLIDEGQDFPIHFYRLCYALTKNRRIVWAFDDFQNIFDTKIQDEKETFGQKDGHFLVDFSLNENQLQDIVLHKCYRNPKRALIAAFSLGLGIYNTRVLQRLEDNQHWNDLGFVVEKGDSSVGAQMIISRPNENSPIDKNEYFGENTILFKKFRDIDEECNAIAKNIIKQIRTEKLRPDDICVISLDEKHISNYFSRIEKLLQKNDIKVFNILNAPNNNIYFSIENHVTLSSINKAKGNEVGMVYIVGVDAAFSENNIDYTVYRNKIFTAITRTKGWVVISGMGDRFNFFQKEIEQLQKNDYKFIFTQPSHDSTNTIFRMMDERQSLINQINKKISDLLKTGVQTEDVLRMIDLNQKK